MKAKGCEMEAVGITYNVPLRDTNDPFNLLTKINQFRRLDHLRTNRNERANPEERTAKSSARRRQVLKDVHCRALPWEVLAIVGPSGAGKTSLLEILAGRQSPQAGSVLVNRHPMNRAQLRKVSAYVTQKDVLFPLLTVEETLMFSAKLRLGLPSSQLVSKVSSLIHELGLDHVSKSRVGDDRLRGVSGGERRRVSIGVDVIHDPEVLILDEPTSGLDSTSALQIVKLLKIMADTRGRTIVLSIHQPGYSIVKLFNSIVMMTNGTVLHHGSVDELGLRMAAMGMQLPLHVNVVEHAIDSIETIHRNAMLRHGTTQVALKSAWPDGKEHEREQRTLQQLFQQSKVGDVEAGSIGAFAQQGFANSMTKETIILAHRFCKNIFRTKELFSWRTIQMLVSGLVLGSIFHNVKEDLIGARERVGLFAFILTFMLSSTEALPVFLQEKEILIKETSCGSYRISSYAIANGLVYFPFLLILAVLFGVPLYWLVGLNPSFEAFLHFLLLIWLILYTANSFVVFVSALVPNFIVGNSMNAGVMGGFFLFSGYFISKSEIPSYWIFVHYLSLFKYPFEGLLLNEFSKPEKCLQEMLGSCVVTADDMLREEGFGNENKWRHVVIMLGFIAFYRFVFYIALRIRWHSC